MKDVFQPFLVEDHFQRFSQTIEERKRGRIWKIACCVGLHHVGVVEIAAWRRGPIAGCKRLLADTSNTKTRWQHKSFLRSGDADVDAPLVHSEVDTGKRTDRVDEQQRRMINRIESGADSSHV